jgi:hypothetical protein
MRPAQGRKYRDQRERCLSGQRIERREVGPPNSFDHLTDALSASQGRDGERAADPLHRAWIDSKTLGDAAYTFTSALTLV